ncbi:MAG: hotdog fold thioesterase [Actinobacteria bacterium]|nr:hotdog fold thioesterase [Actinomycetota bacterium]MCA1721066.1 hotdog fold thioesterase [Actinomycetota bacterium]
MGELNQKLGVVFVEATPERIVATMPVEGNRQPFGLLHGGASVALAESLGSTLAALNCPPDRSAVGIEINATHHRSALSGVVTGVTTPINVGRTLVTSETVVRDDQDRRVCTVRLTCLLRENRA